MLSENYANWSDSEASDEESPTKNFNNCERRCKYCIKLVKKASDLPEHEKKCSVALKTTADLVTCKDGTKRFLCDICFRFFKYLTGLTKHKKWHEPPGGYMCRYCDAKYCTSQELEKHKEESHQVYKCQICKRIHETLQSYLDHIKLEHNGLDRVWVHCDDCGLNFKSQSILSYHKRTKCGTLKPFKCDECGSHYQTQATLNIHKLIHKGEKSFCCSYCGKSFLSKGQLTVHERKHTGEKPYKCELCPKAFSYRESLVTHSSLHTGIKPYICGACDARFSCVGNLQKHRRTRPNSCGLPQFCINKKAAPRASSRIPGTLTMSNVKITKANRVIAPKKGKKTSDKIVVVKEVGEKVAETNCDESEGDTGIEEILEIEETKSVEDVEEQKEDHKRGGSIQFLDIQVLNGQLQKEESSKLDFEETVNCFVVTADNEFQVIPMRQEKDEEINQEDPFKKDAWITEEAELKTKDKGSATDAQESYQDNDMDSTSYDQYNTETETYNEEEMMLVIMKDDSADDDEDDLPLSVIKSSTENIQSDDKVTEEKVDSDPLNTTTNNVRDEPTCTGDTEPDASDDDLENFKSNNLSTGDPYECHICPKVYQHRKPLLKHLKNVHRIDRQETAVCPPNPKSNGSHICIYCKRSYKKLKFLENHIKCHGPEGKLIHKSVCCSRYFATEEDAAKHDRNCHSEKITCPLCGKIYANPEKLAAHKRYAHTSQANKVKKKSNVCQKCGKRFVSKTALTDHERSDCGKSPLYKCENCGKHFHSSGSLKTHKTVHTGELPYLCTYCGKAFRTSGQVKVHQRKHSGEKPFKCDICPKAFAYRESLITHISIHTGERRFKCEGCDRRFSCISNLLMHRKHNLATCGLIPSSTKPDSEPVGVARGVLYFGEKPK